MGPCQRSPDLHPRRLAAFHAAALTYSILETTNAVETSWTHIASTERFELDLANPLPDANRDPFR